MKIGYMTNAFGPLVGAGGGVTSVKDIRYVTMTDDEATLEQITKIGFKSIEVLEGNLTNYADDPQVLIDMLAKYGADMMSVCVGANFIYQDALEDEMVHLRAVAEMAAKVGVKYFVICGGAIRGKGIQPGDVELLAKGLSKAMEITGSIKRVREQVREWRKAGLTVGLVPTMGYLHEGHKSLIDKAVEQNDKVVVSVFVNPMQFGPTEDLESYPRDMDRDAALCEKAGASLIFHPEPEEMYDDNFSSFVDMNTLTGGLCGKTRPIHFRGVCTVVAKLFNIVTPDRAYFGQKDAQQLAVIRHMVNDLSFGIEIVGCPIIREEDGLAKSSRNTYLNEDERKAALVLSRSLKEGRKLVDAGEKDAAKVKKTITDIIEKEALAKIDYVEVVDWNTLEPVENIDGPILTAIAVYIGKTRLIDNFIVE